DLAHVDVGAAARPWHPVVPTFAFDDRPLFGVRDHEDRISAFADLELLVHHAGLRDVDGGDELCVAPAPVAHLLVSRCGFERDLLERRRADGHEAAVDFAEWPDVQLRAAPNHPRPAPSTTSRRLAPRTLASICFPHTWT